MVDALFDAPLQSQGLALAEDDNNHLPSLQDGLDTDGQSHLGDLVHVIAEEPRIGEDRVIGQGLDTGSTGQAGARLVESNVAVFADACEEQVDAASDFYGILVRNTLGLEIGSVAVEDVDVGGVDIDVGEEVLPHERMVRFGMVARDADIFVHVEGDYIFEGDLRWHGLLLELLLSFYHGFTGCRDVE